MIATVSLQEYLRSLKLRKGQKITYSHSDTGFPVPVSFVRKCKNPKKIRVERLYDDPRENCLWTVDINDCSIIVNI